MTNTAPNAIPAVSLITLGIADLARTKRFYAEGFGWTPHFEGDDILFYQMNGLVLAFWRREALAQEMQRDNQPGRADVSLAHNLSSQNEAQALIDRLVRAGAKPLNTPTAREWGGFSGTVADPDGHAWEIAWNPHWTYDAQGNVTM